MINIKHMVLINSTFTKIQKKHWFLSNTQQNRFMQKRNKENISKSLKHQNLISLNATIITMPPFLHNLVFKFCLRVLDIFYFEFIYLWPLNDLFYLNSVHKKAKNRFVSYKKFWKLLKSFYKSSFVDYNIHYFKGLYDLQYFHQVLINQLRSAYII